jgi:hypothetical protein
MFGQQVNHYHNKSALVPSPSLYVYRRMEPRPLLPLLPIWPGFAINTVFYAAVLWMLFAVPLALRKRRRIKRGWCSKCAYDLRGRPPATSTVCPECGAAARPIGNRPLSLASDRMDDIA